MMRLFCAFVLLGSCQFLAFERTHAGSYYVLPLPFDQTIGIAGVMSGQSTLYQLDHTSKTGDAWQSPKAQTFSQLHLVFSSYHDQFKVLTQPPAQPLEGEPAFIFVANNATLKFQLLASRWVRAANGYAQLGSEEFSSVLKVLEHQREQPGLLPAKALPKAIGSLQKAYQRLPPPFLSKPEVESLLETVPGEVAAIQVEANTIVITDGERAKATSGAQGRLSAKPNTAPKNVSKKVDKLVVREQAPKPYDPTIQAKLAEGGRVIDQRKERQEAKGGEVGDGVSARLLQWVYSSGGVLIFIAFVIFLNKMANRK